MLEDSLCIELLGGGGGGKGGDMMGGVDGGLFEEG